MSQRDRLSVKVFALIGAASLVAAAALGILGSFAYLAAASVGMFFVAAALVARALGPGARRSGAILALLGIALLVLGTVVTPVFYLGFGLVAGGITLTLRGPAA